MHAKPLLKTPLGTKIALILGGLLLTLVVLEVFLRLGGWLFLSLQEHRNRVSLKNHAEVRVLCLGESTTALGGESSYPRQLEQVLNSIQNKVKYTVINKGIPAITTTHIATHLKETLDEYKPQIIVTMMGINDAPGEMFSTKNPMGNPLTDFLRNFRIYKLAKLLKVHIEHKLLESEIKKSDEKLSSIEKKLAAKPNSYDYTKLGGIYRVGRQWDKERKALLTAVKLNPKNSEALGYLGLSYKRSGEYDKALPAFINMLQFSPPDSEVRVQAYCMLSETYRLNGQNDQALIVYQKAKENIPQRDIGADIGMAEIYLDEGKVDQARRLLEEHITKHPSAIPAYVRLAHCYQLQGKYDPAEELLRQGVKINPTAAVLYNELGAALIDTKKFAEAESVLQKALTLGRDDVEGDSKSIYINLVRSYEGHGKKAEAEKLQRFLHNISSDYSGETFRNYQKIRKALSDRGIRMIVMQYPMRSIKPLQEILQPTNELVFVSNETVFKNAVAEKSFDFYFSDRFAGDFGHCTPAGNRLIAENLAKTILQISNK